MLLWQNESCVRQVGKSHGHPAEENAAVRSVYSSPLFLLRVTDIVFTSPLAEVPSSAIRLSVCLCLYVRSSLKIRMTELHQIFCARGLSLWLDPSLTTTQYVTYFRFCAWRHIFTKWLVQAQAKRIRRNGACSKVTAGGRSLMSTIVLFFYPR